MKKYLLLFSLIIIMFFTTCTTVNAATVEGSTSTGWSYEESTSTLTLTNYTSTNVISVGAETCQIRSDGDLNIVLVGTNTLSLESTYGIYVEGNLTISGRGTLNITDATKGVYATKNITIKSGVISASSMQARGGGITVDNGKIDLTGNAVASDGQIAINNGNIKSTTIIAKNIIINNGVVASKLSSTLKIEVNDGELNSTNIRISNNDGVFNVTGGKVTINGEVDLSCDASFSGGEIDITDNDGMYVYLGLYVSGGNINIVGGMDGTLDMTGGTLYVDGNIGDVMDSNILGGTLTVKGEIYSGWSTIRISGGTVTVESDGYGLRTADEDIIISGGTISIFGQTQALKAGGEIGLSGNCLSFLTGSSPTSAKVETKYYGEKYVGTIETHSYSDATCISKSSCSICGKKRGELNADNHANDTIVYVVNTSDSHFHDKKHKCCNSLIETEPHDYDSGKVTKAATCKATGVKTYTCSVCKGTKTETIARLTTHTYSNNCDKSCNVCGKTRTVGAHKYSNNCDTTCNYCDAKRTIKHTYSNACDASCNVCKATRTVTHTYKTTTTKATLSKNGSIVKKCMVCGKVASNTAIKYAKTFKLSTTAYTYNGGVKTPSVTVKDSAGKTLKKNTDYTVTYASGRKNVGTYKVTIKMIGKYSGTKTLTFKINPAKTTVSKLTVGKKSITVAITKKSTQVTGYQIQYSTSKKFTNAKTKTISSYKTTKYTLKSLSAKKTYYVRVRTYKTVGKTKYYSGWSTYKYVKTK